MKQEAEAAAGAPPPIDVERIRDVMWNMMLRRAPMEDIVAAVAPYGIAQEHIGAEVRRLAQFKPCGMCGTRMAPGESYFNTSGTEICRRCNAGESIAAADRRVWEAAAEAGGMSAAEIAARSQPQRCPRCGQDTLMAAGAINFDTGIVREAHRCGSCGFQTR
jgi:ribosomal protein S27AE